MVIDSCNRVLDPVVQLLELSDVVVAVRVEVVLRCRLECAELLGDLGDSDYHAIRVEPEVWIESAVGMVVAVGVALFHVLVLVRVFVLVFMGMLVLILVGVLVLVFMGVFILVAVSSFRMVFIRYDAYVRQRSRSYLELPLFHYLHVFQIERNDMSMSVRALSHEQRLAYYDEARDSVAAACVDGVRQLRFADHIAVGGIDRVQHAIIGVHVDYRTVMAKCTGHDVFVVSGWENLDHLLSFRIDHPNTCVCESLRTHDDRVSEEVLRIMVCPDCAYAAPFGHALAVLDQPIVEVIAMWFDEQHTVVTAVRRTVVVVRFSVHPGTGLPTTIPDNLIVEVSDFYADRQDVIRVRVHHRHREQIVL